MTRQDFLDIYDDFYELKNFCSEHGCYELDDVYDSDDRDYYINEELAENREGWRDVLCWLRNIDDGYNWYERNEWGEWNGICDDEFEDYRDRVLDWCEENGIFDEEEEEEEPSPDPEEEREFESFGQDFSVDELYSAASAVYGSIEQERAASAEQAAREAEELRKEAEEAKAREQAELDAAFESFVSDICMELSHSVA